MTKLNLYMECGVKEYWIVNLLLNTIFIYALDDEASYRQLDTAKETGIVQSAVLDGFKVDVEKLFH